MSSFSSTSFFYTIKKRPARTPPSKGDKDLIIVSFDLFAVSTELPTVKVGYAGYQFPYTPIAKAIAGFKTPFAITPSRASMPVYEAAIAIPLTAVSL